jgi:uncharacterized DUF497 family protein
MRIMRIYASAAVQEHMRAKHAVTWPEAEQALRNADSVRRGRTVQGQRRYKATGRTDDGRPLAVIFAVEARYAARVITAFEERR